MRNPRFIALALIIGMASVLSAMEPDTWANTGQKAGVQETKPRIKRGVHWYRYPNQTNDVAQERFAYALYTQGRLRKAANAYQALVYAWPDSPRAASAQLALAKVQQRRGNYQEAFQEYQYLIDNYPGQFSYSEVLESQFQIAKYLMEAPVGSFFLFPGFHAPERAVPLFEKIILNAPSWERAPEAQFSIGRIHEINEDLDEAIAAYEAAQSRYPGTSWALQAAFHEAYCLYQLSDQRPNDENAINAARAALVAFIHLYPSSPDTAKAEGYLRTLNTRLETMVFERARFYDRIARRPQSALQAYRDFVKHFPSSGLAETARLRIEQLSKEVP